MIELAIKGCRIASPAGVSQGDIHIAGGRIAAITMPGLDLGARQTLDAGGLYALPGLVDEHVHMMDPGHTEREDFITGTRAAAAGGVTTVMEHHRTEPPVLSVKELREKIDYLKDRSVVDFCLKGGVTPDNVDKLKGMWDEGVTGFKIFTCELHHQPAMSPGALLECFQAIRGFGGIALLHCEDDSLTQLGEARLKRAGRTDYLAHAEQRSELAEGIAVDAVIAVARHTGCRAVIAHVSSPRILDKIRRARQEDYPVYAETCPHYFYLSTADLAERGPWVKFAPGVRDREAVREMWRRLAAGAIDTIGSDHCPFPAAEKAAGQQDIWAAPNGIPGIETGLKLMLTGVNQGLTDLPRVVQVMCENPARLWGLYPSKGTLAVGADADIVLVDMERREVLDNSRIVSKCGWTPLHGTPVQGAPVAVLLRGQFILRDGAVVGEPGRGRFLPRQYECSI